jgi:predicted small secreted protein
MPSSLAGGFVNARLKLHWLTKRVNTPGTGWAAMPLFGVNLFPQKGPPMTKVFSVFALLLALGTAACNTVQGAGMDIKATGNAVERAAEDAKH